MARDDRRESCSSYTNINGTTVTDCKRPGRKPTHCSSYVSITGTTHESCR
jgi:hypothetical protein